MNQIGTDNYLCIAYTDDTVLACGAESVLSSIDGCRPMLASPEISELLPLLQKLQPHVVLVDLTPQVTFGLLSALHTAVPDSRIILWGRTFSEELLNQARDLGICGLLQRNCTRQEFIDGIRNVARGEQAFVQPAPKNATKVFLTRRESQLVALLVQGLRNKEIATCLGITTGTVRIYMSKLFVKIGARDRFEVAVFGMKNAYCGEAAWDGQNAFVTECDDDRARPAMRSLVLVEPKRRRAYAPVAKASGA
jgi:DNA-binding NarL/FixJ family response regulator